MRPLCENAERLIDVKNDVSLPRKSRFIDCCVLSRYVLINVTFSVIAGDLKKSALSVRHNCYYFIVILLSLQMRLKCLDVIFALLNTWLSALKLIGTLDSPQNSIFKVNWNLVNHLNNNVQTNYSKLEDIHGNHKRQYKAPSNLFSMKFIIKKLKSICGTFYTPYIMSTNDIHLKTTKTL